MDQNNNDKKKVVDTIPQPRSVRPDPSARTDQDPESLGITTTSFPDGAETVPPNQTYSADTTDAVADQDTDTPTDFAPYDSDKDTTHQTPVLPYASPTREQEDKNIRKQSANLSPTLGATPQQQSDAQEAQKRKKEPSSLDKIVDGASPYIKNVNAAKRILGDVKGSNSSQSNVFSRIISIVVIMVIMTQLGMPLAQYPGVSDPVSLYKKRIEMRLLDEQEYIVRKRMSYHLKNTNFDDGSEFSKNLRESLEGKGWKFDLDSSTGKLRSLKHESGTLIDITKYDDLTELSDAIKSSNGDQLFTDLLGNKGGLRGQLKSNMKRHTTLFGDVWAPAVETRVAEIQVKDLEYASHLADEMALLSKKTTRSSIEDLEALRSESAGNDAMVAKLDEHIATLKELEIRNETRLSRIAELKKMTGADGIDRLKVNAELEKLLKETNADFEMAQDGFAKVIQSSNGASPDLLKKIITTDQGLGKMKQLAAQTQEVVARQAENAIMGNHLRMLQQFPEGKESADNLLKQVDEDAVKLEELKKNLGGLADELGVAPPGEKITHLINNSKFATFAANLEEYSARGLEKMEALRVFFNSSLRFPALKKIAQSFEDNIAKVKTLLSESLGKVSKNFSSGVKAFVKALDVAIGSPKALEKVAKFFAGEGENLGDAPTGMADDVLENSSKEMGSVLKGAKKTLGAAFSKLLGALDWAMDWPKKLLLEKILPLIVEPLITKLIGPATAAAATAGATLVITIITTALDVLSLFFAVGLLYKIVQEAGLEKAKVAYGALAVKMKSGVDGLKEWASQQGTRSFLSYFSPQQVAVTERGDVAYAAELQMQPGIAQSCGFKALTGDFISTCVSLDPWHIYPEDGLMAISKLIEDFATGPGIILKQIVDAYGNLQNLFWDAVGWIATKYNEGRNWVLSFFPKIKELQDLVFDSIGDLFKKTIQPIVEKLFKAFSDYFTPPIPEPKNPAEVAEAIAISEFYFSGCRAMGCYEADSKEQANIFYNDIADMGMETYKHDRDNKSIFAWILSPFIEPVFGEEQTQFFDTTYIEKYYPDAKPLIFDPSCLEQLGTYGKDDANVAEISDQASYAYAEGQNKLGKCNTSIVDEALNVMVSPEVAYSGAMKGLGFIEVSDLVPSYASVTDERLNKTAEVLGVDTAEAYTPMKASNVLYNENSSTWFNGYCDESKPYCIDSSEMYPPDKTPTPVPSPGDSTCATSYTATSDIDYCRWRDGVFTAALLLQKKAEAGFVDLERCQSQGNTWTDKTCLMSVGAAYLGTCQTSAYTCHVADGCGTSFSKLHTSSFWHTIPGASCKAGQGNCDYCDAVSYLHPKISNGSGGLSSDVPPELASLFVEAAQRFSTTKITLDPAVLASLFLIEHSSNGFAGKTTIGQVDMTKLNWDDIPYKGICEKSGANAYGPMQIVDSTGNILPTWKEEIRQALQASCKETSVEPSPTPATGTGTGGVNPRGGSLHNPTFTRRGAPFTAGVLTGFCGAIWYGIHKGLDFMSYGLTDITMNAADAGRVIVKSDGACSELPYATKPDRNCGNGFGKYVIIDVGNGLQEIYAHFHQIFSDIQVGQTIPAGKPLGIMGTTGYSDGIHLHYQVNCNGVYVNPLTITRSACSSGNPGMSACPPGCPASQKTNLGCK